MTAEYRLPNGLLIILHLHLLNYPLQDATGYDERLFDPSRGMRDRSKAMEDITHFLVGKIEGSKERVKSILSTYPCLQPSDTTAYRIALSKYLETMRNAIVHTTHAGDPKGKKPTPSDEASAWWWKDVVVRKSILDECSGDRFERLMLALSSHAILKNTARTSSPLHLSSSPVKDRENDLDALSRVYTTRLEAAQSARLNWERAAANLVRRQLDLELIRGRLADPKLSGSSKYDSLETNRLLALRDSRQKDLLRGHWRGREGQAALRLITLLAGLLDESPATTVAQTAEREDTGVESPPIPMSQSQVADEAPPPLPIAAAHHPAHLHALRATLFPAKAKASHHAASDQTDGPASIPVSHAVTERLAAIDKLNISLQTALANAQSMHAQLQHRLGKARAKAASAQPVKKAKGASGPLQLDTSLWSPRTGKGVDFIKLADDSTLAQFGLAGPPSDNAIEDRIAHIRNSLLPPFTADPLPASDSEPEAPAHPPASRLHQPSSRTQLAARGHSRGVPPSSKLSKLSEKQRAPSGTKQVRVADAQKAPRAPSAAISGRGSSIARANAAGRRLSRRASAARTRRSTMFGRGSDADILRIVESVQDRSDLEMEDGTDNEEPVHGPRTPVRSHIQGTRGMLLSSTKDGPRQSFDIERYERVNVPRLPSAGLQSARELDEEEDEQMLRAGPAEYAEDDAALFHDDDDEDEEAYEGNSMTLADILLQAGNASMQLLGEDELQDMSDWE